MVPNSDLALYDGDGQLIGVVEVKTKIGTTRDWTAKLRRNLLAHGDFQSVGYFLLVTPDRRYVWKQAGNAPAEVEPTYEVDASPLLQPYFVRAGVDPTTISGAAFELIVASWLADLVRSVESSRRPGAEQGWLLESSFLQAIQNGRVEFAAAA